MTTAYHVVSVCFQNSSETSVQLHTCQAAVSNIVIVNDNVNVIDIGIDNNFAVGSVVADEIDMDELSGFLAVSCRCV